MLPSSGLGLRPDEMGQKGLKQLHLWCHSQKTQNEKVFFHCRLEDWLILLGSLNSSQAQLPVEIFPCKNMYKLLDFRLILPETKVLIIFPVAQPF